MAMGNNNFAMKMLLAIAFSIFMLQSPSAYAASTGHIFGQVLDGSKKNAPLARQSVTLKMAQGNLSIDVATVTTDIHGSYSFANLSTGRTTDYILSISYQGAQYTSNPITLDTKPMQQVNLTVYEATTSTANMAIVRATILLHKPDAQKGSIPVSELIIFRNLDNRTYVGSLDASHGKPNALRFALPHTARNIVLGKGFDGYQAIQVNSGFAANAAVPPGDSQFAFTFDMPYTTSSYDFGYAVLYPTVQLTVLVPLEIQASSDTLTSQAPVTADQNTFSLLQTSALLPGKEVHVQLDGLPVITPVINASVAASNPVPSWLIVILLVMAAILLGTWLFYRSTRRPASKKKLTQQKQSEQRHSKKEKVTS
jgi:hypothetical protein